MHLYAIQRSIPVFADSKFRFEGMYEMVGVFLTNIFYSKVIDNEAELELLL